MLSQITSMRQCLLLHDEQSLRNFCASAARAKVDYEIGTRHIRFSEAACAQLATSWAGVCPKDGQLVVHESHQDCVTRLPEGSTLLASSGDTRVEVWSQGDHVLCIQGRIQMLAGRLWQTPTFIPGQGHVQVPVLLATRSACMLCTGCVEALWSQQGVF